MTPLRHPRSARLAGIWLCVITGCHAGGIRQRSPAELLADPTYAWITDSTTHTRIHYLAGSPAQDSLAKLERDIEVAWTSAADFVGSAAGDRVIHVFAVPTREMVGQVSGVPGNAPALNFTDQRVIIAWVPAQGWRNSHEFVHIMAQDAWGATREWWLGEGVAIAGSGWFGIDVNVAAKCLGAAGKLVPLDMVVRPGAPEQRLQNVVGAEAGSFVHFLIDRYGRHSVARVYSKGASAVQPTYGKPLTQLEQEWHQRLDSMESGSPSCPAVVRAALPPA
jgi:hypothetical protein